MRWIMALLLLLLSVSALAGSATLSWTPPTQNEDGTPITDLAGYWIYYGTVSGNYPNSIQIADPTISTYVVDSLAAGNWFFVATAYNTAGIESAYSNEATKTVPPDVPLPPTNLTVVDPESLVYSIGKIYDGMVLTPVGTVPGGTPCKADSVNGKHVVDRQYVMWSSTNDDFAVVVADCG